MKEPRDQAVVNEQWRKFLTGDDPTFPRYQRVFRLLPATPRCNVCYAPFGGAGGYVMRVMGRDPAKMNTNICGVCETAARLLSAGDAPD